MKIILSGRYTMGIDPNSQRGRDIGLLGDQRSSWGPFTPEEADQKEKELKAEGWWITRHEGPEE